jgi:hypothetical protein
MPKRHKAKYTFTSARELIKENLHRAVTCVKKHGVNTQEGGKLSFAGKLTHQ